MITVVALLILGPKGLPEAGRSIGRMMRELRKATEDFKSTIDDELHKPEEPDKQLPSGRDPVDLKTEQEQARKTSEAGPSEASTEASDSESEPREDEPERRTDGPALDVRPPEEPSVARNPSADPR